MIEGFGLNRGGESWEEYIGGYVIIYPATHQGSFSGKLVRVEEGYGILNPHQSGYYDKEKGLVRCLVNKDSKIDMTHIVAIEPTTKKSLEEACEYLNRKNNQDSPKQKSDN